MVSKQQKYILIYFESPLEIPAVVFSSMHTSMPPRRLFMMSFRYILDWFALNISRLPREESACNLLKGSVPAAICLQSDPALGAVDQGGVLLAVLAEDVTLGALRREKICQKSSETGLALTGRKSRGKVDARLARLALPACTESQRSMQPR